MPIRKHGIGWEVRVQYLGSRISRSFSSFKDAQEFERRHKTRISDHRVGRTPQHSLEEALERWLDNEAKALGSYKNLENKVAAMFEAVPIQGVPLADLAEYAEAITRKALEAGLKPATINRRLAILRRVGRLAFRKWKWLENDEAARMTFVPGEEPRYVQASREQAEKLLRVARGNTRKAIQWAIGTGLRQGELRRVQPHHFRDGALAVEKKTKTGKPRMVPLPPFLRPQDFPYGLTGPDVEERFREARAKAGMPWLQFRDLRRTYGSWMAQRTGNLKAVQQALGHTTSQITSKHYAHLMQDDVRKAVHKTFAGMARGRGKRKKAA
jgi:integrase